MKSQVSRKLSTEVRYGPAAYASSPPLLQLRLRIACSLARSPPLAHHTKASSYELSQVCCLCMASFLLPFSLGTLRPFIHSFFMWSHVLFLFASNQRSTFLAQSLAVVDVDATHH